MNNLKNKLLVITGPTATGKSALGVELAKVVFTMNGVESEIISADSRQVYTGLDIGSAKITSNEMQDIPHYLIDVADPKDIFNVSDFKKLVQEKISEIHNQGKLPIIVGGTGMYISAVIDDQEFPQVPPNMELRAELETLSVEELSEKLERVNFERSKNIDKHNKVRLVRALEIALAPTHPPTPSRRGGTEHSVLIIGLTLPKEELVSRIEKRIDDRIPALFDEIKKLLADGISPERLNSFGLEYRYGLEYVEGKIDLENFKKTLAIKTWQYVRRQMTWWKRDPRVIWMNPITDNQKILETVQDFLKK